MAKSYHQYCPIACALDLVGERWSLLVVRELLEHGELRYSDLNASLDGCGTNILASRLKQLEQGGVVRRRRLPPPASATVYELTEYGQGLRPVMHQLAHWGARVMGPPRAEDLEPGWLVGALQMAFPPTATGACVEFRIGAEVASIADGEARAGGTDGPDAVVIGDAAGFYRLFVDRDIDAVSVEGSADALGALLAVLPPAAPPVAIAPADQLSAA
ncbi:MAG: helix-turn-helix transcriptional regulator [Thermoleophilia bacterium]|nr:helix-turn-helix transcriptional regulator [Thermoleophilia bacterium]MDH4341172.1 helix-turn-helix transcriptional regulator [Thermoleophilia bacterium]MDH5282080.1 helix-turn-helix transcriptional regulator [Thermoleophilia bacterium]